MVCTSLCYIPFMTIWTGTLITARYLISLLAHRVFLAASCHCLSSRSWRRIQAATPREALSHAGALSGEETSFNILRIGQERRHKVYPRLYQHMAADTSYQCLPSKATLPALDSHLNSQAQFLLGRLLFFFFCPRFVCALCSRDRQVRLLAGAGVMQEPL